LHLWCNKYKDYTPFSTTVSNRTKAMFNLYKK